MDEPRTEPGWVEVGRNTARAYLRRWAPRGWFRVGLVGLICCAVLASTWLAWERTSNSRSQTEARMSSGMAVPVSTRSASVAVSPYPTVTSARPTPTSRPLTRQEARYLRRAKAIEPLLIAGGRTKALRLAQDLCVQFYDGVPRSVRAARLVRKYPITQAEAIEVVEAACASFCPE